MFLLIYRIDTGLNTQQLHSLNIYIDECINLITIYKNLIQKKIIRHDLISRQNNSGLFGGGSGTDVHEYNAIPQQSSAQKLKMYKVLSDCYGMLERQNRGVTANTKHATFRNQHFIRTTTTRIYVC